MTGSSERPNAELAIDDGGHVTNGFRVSRYAVVVIDRLIAGIVGGCNQDRVFELGEEDTQVAHATVNIRSRIADVGNAETGGGVRHQLHRSAGTFRAVAPLVETALRPGNGLCEVRIDAVANRGRLYEGRNLFGFKRGVRARVFIGLVSIFVLNRKFLCS